MSKQYIRPILLFPGLKVNDWRKTKLELNYLLYSVTVKVCCQLENEYKLINSIFIWHAALGELFHSGAVQMFNFQLIHGEHRVQGAAVALPNSECRRSQVSVEKTENFFFLPPLCISRFPPLSITDRLSTSSQCSAIVAKAGTVRERLRVC